MTERLPVKRTPIPSDFEIGDWVRVLSEDPFGDKERTISYKGMLSKIDDKFIVIERASGTKKIFLSQVLMIGDA